MQVYIYIKDQQEKHSNTLGGQYEENTNFTEAHSSW